MDRDRDGGRGRVGTAGQARARRRTGPQAVPSSPGQHAPETRSQRRLAGDLRTLATFVEIHCHGRHGDRPRAPVQLRSHDIEATIDRVPQLCDACRRLLAHAFVMRSRCPLDPKPMCKKCPVHCYAPKYRRQIREVMRYAGMRLVVTGRLHVLWHLIA